VCVCVCVGVCVCVVFVMCGCLDNVYTLNLFGYPDLGFSVLFLSCKANARVKLAKTGHGQHSSKFVICVVLFVIRVVLLLIVMFHVLFMCKCVLPPGVNSIAVDKYINISKQIRHCESLKSRRQTRYCFNQLSRHGVNTSHIKYTLFVIHTS
jgi:hypothetical protein